MSKKFKVIMAVLVAVLLLMVSGTAVAMAQDEADTTTGVQSLLARVAGLLGITEGELTDAFNQAREEMREECQATGDCNPGQADENRVNSRWQEKRQGFEEKQPGIGKGFQGDQSNRTEGQQNRRFRISESTRSQQMIVVPEGYNIPDPSLTIY